jgi:hypothetical protein
MDHFDDEVVGANVRRAFEDTEQGQARIQQFQDGIREMPGPLGVLLRQIGHAWAEFEAAEELGGTTFGEEVRLRGVLGEAMSTLDWLREGVQP